MAIEELIERIGGLTAELEGIEDPERRRLAEELSDALMDLHREGIERMLAAVGPEAARRELADDEVVRVLLLLHDLHPEPLEERVRAGLETVRPYMESHGGDVELLGVEDGIAHLRLVGSCNGCAASASTLELAVQRAIEESAPDLLGMEVEGAVEPPVTGIPLTMAPGNGSGNGGAPLSLSSWVVLEGIEDLGEGESRIAEVAGRRLLVAAVEGSVLAYLDACAACGATLEDAALSEGVLACPSCARQFFLPRAGRSLDDAGLHLDPVPLLADTAGARVALPA
jgi:Fe-S cluster biogenesis protein NfuA/nitrite reductase/ring-hydroxylating ferredoxin subunit